MQKIQAPKNRKLSYKEWERLEHADDKKMSKNKFKILHALKSLEKGLIRGYHETEPYRKVADKVINRVGKNVYGE
jgi:hypothetical protein